LVEVVKTCSDFSCLIEGTLLNVFFPLLCGGVISKNKMAAVAGVLCFSNTLVFFSFSLVLPARYHRENKSEQAFTLDKPEVGKAHGLKLYPTI
jgi:uncharacterized membrane protein